MLAEDPFEFVSSDDDAPVFMKKTPPPPAKRIPPSIKKTPNLGKKKTPRIILNKNNDEINEMLDIKRAIEESKKTALQEERARRYQKRRLLKTDPPSAGNGSLENDNSVSSPSKSHQESSVNMSKVTTKNKGISKKEKQHGLQKEPLHSGSEKNSNGSSPNSIQKSASSVKLTSTPVKIGPPSSRESSVTPTQTPTNKDSPISGDAGSSFCGNLLSLMRKRLPHISKEPTIKLSRVDTELLGSLNKMKSDQQKSDNKKCEATHDGMNAIKSNATSSSSFKSNKSNTNIPTTSQNTKDNDKEKKLQKLSKFKSSETVKFPKAKKDKPSLSETPQYQLKKCPSLYAPHGTDPCDYLPVVVRFFEDFKFQLRMAQDKCITFVSWSHPVTSSKKDWQAVKDAGKSPANGSDVSGDKLPLMLSVPHSSSAVKQQHKEAKSGKDVMEVDLLFDWDCHAFDSDDQRLFHDSDDPNVDQSKPSQTIDTSNQTPPRSMPAATSPSEHVEKMSPDISIDISSSSNSNTSSVIHHGRRKRKLLGRKILGSSDVTVTGSKQSSSSRQSLTASLPRGPVHHHSSSSQNDASENYEESEESIQFNKKSIIDLTELEDTAETKPCGPHIVTESSQDKQATCPMCQQLFSATYIAIHAANCELHVDKDDTSNSKIPPSSLTASSSKFRQTTLTRQPLSTKLQQKKILESDSDTEMVMPPTKKRNITRTRKLISDKISLVCSEESDDIDVPQKQSYLMAGSRSVTNSIFKSASLVQQGADDIESYSSEDEKATPTTRDTIIDYKNQFSNNSTGKVSKELLMGDNMAFILARKKKWMTAKKGREMGKSRQRKWRFKGKGKK